MYIVTLVSVLVPVMFIVVAAKIILDRINSESFFIKDEIRGLKKIIEEPKKRKTTSSKSTVPQIKKKRTYTKRK